MAVRLFSDIPVADTERGGNSQKNRRVQLCLRPDCLILIPQKIAGEGRAADQIRSGRVKHQILQVPGPFLRHFSAQRIGNRTEFFAEQKQMDLRAAPGKPSPEGICAHM